MSGIPQGGTTNQSYWKLMYGLWVVLIHEPQNEPEWFKKPARKMQVLRHNLRTGCTISSLLRVLFSFSMSEPLAPPSLCFGLHLWDPSMISGSINPFFPGNVTSTSPHHPPRQNLPPVPFLPPPAAPGMHRPSAPPPAGRGQILDATWGAPQRPATPAPLWAPLRVFELRDGGNNKGWAEEVCWWVQTVKSS